MKVAKRNQRIMCSFPRDFSRNVTANALTQWIHRWYSLVCFVYHYSENYVIQFDISNHRLHWTFPAHCSISSMHKPFSYLEKSRKLFYVIVLTVVVCYLSKARFIFDCIDGYVKSNCILVVILLIYISISLKTWIYRHRFQSERYGVMPKIQRGYQCEFVEGTANLKKGYLQIAFRLKKSQQIQINCTICEKIRVFLLPP